MSAREVWAAAVEFVLYVKDCVERSRPVSPKCGETRKGHPPSG
jgi:hypothetical protein